MDSRGSSDVSSDLSSVGSLSPPPPEDYPSPVSSQESCTAFAASQPSHNEPSLGDDDLPPPKKRKIAAIKPRITEYLDLQLPRNSPATDQKAQLALLLKVLQKKRKIVVIAGAGISVSAGIPDFRSSTGLFSTLRSEHKLKSSGKHLFDASVYQTDSSTSSFHDMVRSLSKLVSDARPTAFHQMLATLAKEGRLMRLYTQNVDGIDTSLPPLVTSVPLSMKGPWPRTIQLHGGLEKMVCSKCNHLSDFEAALFDGPLPPPCTACMETDKVRTDHAGKRSHGIGRLRPRIVLYNEHNPDEEAIGTVVSADLRTRPDALIVVGTSMKIPGVRRMVKEMCGVIRGRKGGLTVWINHEAPGKEFGECWDLVVRGACDEVALQADMRRWDDDSPDYQSSTESEVERAKQRVGEVNVVIRSTSAVLAKPAMLTPAPSPGPEFTKRPKISLKLRLPKPPTQLPDSKTANSKIGALPVKRKYIFKNKSAKNTPAVSTKNPKITTSYKISKPGHASIKKQNAKKAVTPSRSFPGGDEAGMPMAPISPQAARNNGPVQSPTDPNSIKAESRSSEERMKRRSEEIVSPTGTLPSGMSMLLHH